MTFSSSLKKWWKATKCSSQAPVKRAERDWSDKSDGNTDSRESSSMDVMCSSTEVSGTNNPVPTSGPPAAGQDSQEQQHKQEQQSQQRQQQQQQQQQQQGNSQQGTGQQQQHQQPSKPSTAELLQQFSNELKAGGEANRYRIREVIGKGSYGVVCSAVDQYTGEKVAIKKITNIFEHVSDATRILREIKLLRLLKHPDVVEIKHICLPPSSRDYKDIYVVFELMETDLHQVIKANDDLTPEHHQFFLYQMLRGLKYIHSAKVYHRDLKPKNILANSDCKLKICDFGLARPAFDNMPTSVFWTDYVATRWYRAPELCGSFFAKYTSAIDVWSVGCMFAEVLLGKPLFPGKNVVHQLELITDLLGTPPPEVIIKVRNEKARRFLSNMKPKPGIPFEEAFPKADPGALAILKRLLAFDPANRPSAEEALAHPYFRGLHLSSREPVAQPVSKLAFQFDRCKLSIEDVRELIYQEILEYHPHLKGSRDGKMVSSFQNPSAVENFKRQFFFLEQNPGTVLEGKNNGPCGLVSCNSNPREIGAEVEPRFIDHSALQSQASAPMKGSQPTASHTHIAQKPPQLDQEDLELLRSLDPNSQESQRKSKVSQQKSRSKDQAVVQAKEGACDVPSTTLEGPATAASDAAAAYRAWGSRLTSQL